MTNKHKLDLKDLRLAATERNQEQLQYTLKKLLQGLGFYVALSVPLERIYNFLEIFESYYPEEEWVRKLVLAINSYGVAPDDTIAEMALQQDFSAPGMGNFIKAVYDVVQAMQDKHTGEARLGFLASATVNIIMAELVEAWYGDREADWERVRANQLDPITGDYTDPEATQIAYRFWVDHETAALDTASWLEIAANIEKKIQRRESRST